MDNQLIANQGKRWPFYIFEWESGRDILLIFMDYPSPNRRFQLLSRYFRGKITIVRNLRLKNVI